MWQECTRDAPAVEETLPQVIGKKYALVSASSETES